MPAINLLPPDPQIVPPSAPPAIPSQTAPAANGPASPSPFEDVLSNAVNPPPAADPPPAAAAPSALAAPPVSNAKTTSAPDSSVPSAVQNSDGKADETSGQPTPNNAQPLASSSNSSASSVAEAHPQTAKSTDNSKGKSANAPPPTPPAPDGPPIQLMNALLLSDTLVSAAVKPAASAAAPESKPEGRDASAAPDAQTPAANPPPALFAGLNLAGLNLAVVVPIVAPAPAPSLPPAGVITPATAKSSPAPTSPTDTAIVATAQNAVPAAAPIEIPVTTIATAATATLELNSLVQTVSVSETPASPAVAKATIPQTVNGDGGLKAQSKDVSAVTQVAAVLPVTSNNSDNSRTAQQTVSQTTPLPNSEQPQRAATSPVTTGVTAVVQTPAQNAPAATPASGDPFSSSSAITSALPVDTHAVAATVSAKVGAAPPTDNSNSTPAAPPPVTANPDAAIFAAAPAALQVHAGVFAGGQPAGNNPGINSAQIIEQVAYALQVSHAGGQEMQIQLSPPDLGSLQINVSVHEGVLSARIEAQSPTTQQVLVDNLSQLKNSLTQQGVAFDRIDVRLAASQTGSSSSGSADSSFAQQQQGAFSWEQNPLFDPTETDAPPSVSPQMPRLFSRVAVMSLDVTV